jgi:hypothetical protein
MYNFYYQRIIKIKLYVYDSNSNEYDEWQWLLK